MGASSLVASQICTVNDQSIQNNASVIADRASSVACAAQSAPTAPPPSSSTLYGFNYIPSGYPDWLTTDFAGAQNRIANDIGLMKSMGVNLVRISVFGFGNGLPPWKYDQPVGAQNWDTGEITAVEQNLPQFIKEFGAAGIKVIVAFVPINYWNDGPHPKKDGTWDPGYDPHCRIDGIPWWQCRYANRWHDFARDFSGWSKEISEKIEQDPQASANVLYYDLINEVQFHNEPGTDMKVLVDTVIQNVSVPDDKMGFSVLQPVYTADLSILKRELSAFGKQPAYIEAHCYPGLPTGNGLPSCGWPAKNGTVARWLDQAYQNLRTGWPSFATKFVIGEFGGNYDGGQGLGQAAYDIEIVNWAKNHANLAALVHWNLYDDKPNYGKYKIGVAPTAGVAQGTRNTYVVLGTMRGALIDGGDFENGVDAWYFGGSAAQASAIEGDAVTGSHYGRLKVTAPGENWFCTPNFVLADGAHVATGGFFRTALTRLTIATRFFDRNWTVLGQDDVTLTQPSGGQWRQIQEQSLSKRVAVWDGPYAAQVCFVITAPAGTSPSNPSYLDLDSITVYDY